MTDCAQRRNTRRRFRGTVFMALQAAPDGAPDGLDRAFRRIAVCADYARACCALAQWPAGEIWRVPPGDGAPLRRYLEGGPSPFETVPALAFPRNLVTEIADAAEVATQTARRAVSEALTGAPGAGGQLWRGRTTLPWVSIGDS